MQYRKKIGKISLIHIVYPVFNQNSRRMSTVPIARGIIAIGPISIGIVSFGIMGLGFFTFGFLRYLNITLDLSNFLLNHF